MIRRAVVYNPEAERDLLDLYEYLANAGSPMIATAYMSQVKAWLDGFDVGAERGTLRGDLRPSLRIIGFERRITVAFMVDDTQVVILRLFYGGQDWGTALSEG